jgi:aspartokinase/homoserine dehydrogenase 1
MTELKRSEVLIVEDDESWQEIYTEMLEPEGEGYEIALVDNRDDAVAELATHQFVLVIIDLKVPQSSRDIKPEFEHGLAVVDYVSNLPYRPKILVVTGYQQLPLDVGRVLGRLGVEVATKEEPENVARVLDKVRQQLRPRPTDIVMKFGGTSMGSTESIDTVAVIVAKHVEESSVPCTVVVSAMSGVTDSLLECAADAHEGELASLQKRLERLCVKHTAAADALITRNDLREAYLAYLDKVHESLSRMCEGVAVLKDDTSRTLDRISGYGERLSARLLAAVLESRKVASVAVDTTEVIITDDVFGSASPLSDETSKRVKEVLMPILERGAVPVVTGFIGSTQDGTPTTLGRGGSDYSATILGSALGAKEVQIWTDVTGVMDADPNLVPDAATITQMSYEKAAELTYHGAKVLHAKALGPVMGRRIPVRILNTFAPDEPGTLIGPSEDKSYKGGVLVSSSGLGLVTVSSDLDQSWTPSTGARALTALARDDIEIMGYSQSFSRRTLSITLRETDATRAVSTLSREFKEGDLHRVKNIVSRGQIAAISIIGEQYTHSAFVGRVLAAFGSASIEVLGVVEVPTENSFSFLVDQSDLKEAVSMAHGTMAKANTRGMES